MMANLLNAKAGFQQVLKTLKKYSGVWYQMDIINDGKHAILKPLKPGFTKYYAVFKREHFKSFNEQFKHFNYHSLAGYGESINEEWLEKAIEKDCEYLLFSYPDKKVYIIPTMQFKNFSERYALIRKQHGGETTYSVPLKLMKRLE